MRAEVRMSVTPHLWFIVLIDDNGRRTGHIDRNGDVSEYIHYFDSIEAAEHTILIAKIKGNAA